MTKYANSARLDYLSHHLPYPPIRIVKADFRELLVRGSGQDVAYLTVLVLLLAGCWCSSSYSSQFLLVTSRWLVFKEGRLIHESGPGIGSDFVIYFSLAWLEPGSDHLILEAFR